jgi:hypothetical protein
MDASGPDSTPDPSVNGNYRPDLMHPFYVDETGGLMLVEVRAERASKPPKQPLLDRARTGTERVEEGHCGGLVAGDGELDLLIDVAGYEP